MNTFSLYIQNVPDSQYIFASAIMAECCESPFQGILRYIMSPSIWAVTLHFYLDLAL